MVGQADKINDQAVSEPRCVDSCSHLLVKEVIWIGLPEDQTCLTGGQLVAKPSPALSLRLKDAHDLQPGWSYRKHRRDLDSLDRLQESLLEQVRYEQLNARQSNGTSSQYDHSHFIGGARVAVTDPVQHR